MKRLPGSSMARIGLEPPEATGSPLTAISRVDFYDNGNWIGRADSRPYNIQQSNAEVGLHALSAVATDIGGFYATSALVQIRIVPNFRESLHLNTLWCNGGTNNGISIKEEKGNGR